MDLYKKITVSGVTWSSISQFSRQIIVFISTVILVKLLSPTDFGLMGMATVIAGFVEVFKNLGVSAAIIQKDEVSENFISTMYWVSLCFGTFVSIVLYLAAPIAELYYKEPRVTPIIRWLSFNFIILSFSVVNRALLEKKLKFKTLARIEIFSSLLGAIVGISTALLGKGVWSLVYQSITRVYCSTLFLLIFAKYRPKIIFIFDEVKKVFAFSFHLTSFNIVNYVLRSADYLIIGRFLGAESLGFYSLGYKLMLIPVQNFSVVIGRVMFPIYSKIQKENKKITDLVLSSSAAIGFVSIPLMLGLMSVSHQLIITVFGDKWAASIPIIMILAPIGIIQSVSVPLNAIFLAKGRSDLLFYVGLVTSTIIVFAYIIGLSWGINGVATAYAVSGALILYPTLVIRFRLIELPVSKLFSVLYKSLISGTFMAIGVTFVENLFPSDMSYFRQLCILIPFGGISYSFISILINKEQLYQFRRLIKKEA